MHGIQGWADGLLRAANFDVGAAVNALYEAASRVAHAQQHEGQADRLHLHDILPFSSLDMAGAPMPTRSPSAARLRPRSSRALRTIAPRSASLKFLIWKPSAS